MLCLGQLVPLSDPAHGNFYAVNAKRSEILYYYPVGYEFTRTYKDRTVLCSIERRKDRPVFTVAECDDDGFPFVQASASSATGAVRDALGVTVSGPAFFGLSQPAIHARLMRLRHAEYLQRALSLTPTLHYIQSRLPALVKLGPLRCEHCGRHFACKKGMRLHLRRLHSNRNGRIPIQELLGN